MTATFHELARRLLALPTASFHEHHVAAAVLQHVARRPDVTAAADAFGNLLLSTATRGGLCLTAHLDHPALGFARPESARDVVFERLGGVPDELTREAPVRIYSCEGADGSVPTPLAHGRVHAFLEEGAPADPEARPAFRVRLDEPGPIPPGAFAVWDLPETRVDGSRLEAGACDDVAGVAVALAVLDAVRAAGGALSLLLTRAEETGLAGMLAAVDAGAAGELAGDLTEDVVYVNIECSSCRAGAPLGDGPVIRVGDRRWIFDAGVTGALEAAGVALQDEDEGFRVQRRLMDAGVCEATPLARSGRAVGAVALPLDNYHNRGERRLRAEAVDLGDADGLVALLTRLALHADGAAGAVRAANEGLDERLAARRSAHVDRLLQNAAAFPRPERDSP